MDHVSGSRRRSGSCSASIHRATPEIKTPPKSGHQTPDRHPHSAAINDTVKVKRSRHREGQQRNTESKYDESSTGDLDSLNKVGTNKKMFAGIWKLIMKTYEKNLFG